MRRHWAFLLAAAVLAGPAAACADDATRPTGSQIEGMYVATTFTVTTPDTLFDELAMGASVSLTLHGDRTTTGTLALPTATTDLAGQWDTLGGALHLHLGAPTFLTHVAFAVAPNQLEGDFILQNGTIHVKLMK